MSSGYWSRCPGLRHDCKKEMARHLAATRKCSMLADDVGQKQLHRKELSTWL